MERRIDRQEPAVTCKSSDAKRFRDLVARHRPDMAEVGIRIGRSKDFCLTAHDLARIAPKRLGLIGKGKERDRRPTQHELDRIITARDENPRQSIPVGGIVRFAVATAMRQEEACRVEWRDFDPGTWMLLIRDRRTPAGRTATISASRCSTSRVMTRLPV